ncbi:transcription antitermination factor NusB [Flavobacterium sp.]|uniref:transcription antitermination factor NusB n=1 Tax=Flavobacterium sp. TaxID=239 RepID=UPI002B4AC09B|nr:transcription antitermination factor NusB [Flavobacterium sp.]
MQTIYAMHQKGSDSLEKEEKFLLSSIENLMELYLIMVSSLIELTNKENDFIEVSRKKHLATPQERNPNLKFVNNAVLNLLKNSKSIEVALDTHKINNWKANDDAVLLLLNDVKQSKIYEDYMNDTTSSFEKDQQFIIDLFSEVIAPNEKLYSYLEDYKLTWVDDIPVVNTQILKQLKQLNPKSEFRVSSLFKDDEDREYAISLFRKTVLNEGEFAKEYIDKTPNWDVDRIAEMDTILLKMAICELLKFPSVPVKVTINEFLEIAKEYSTPKSSIFINGILDNLVKSYQATGRMNKSGRGLME